MSGDAQRREHCRSSGPGNPIAPYCCKVNKIFCRFIVALQPLFWQCCVVRSSAAYTEVIFSMKPCKQDAAQSNKLKNSLNLFGPETERSSCVSATLLHCCKGLKAMRHFANGVICEVARAGLQIVFLQKLRR